MNADLGLDKVKVQWSLQNQHRWPSEQRSSTIYLKYRNASAINSNGVDRLYTASKKNQRSSSNLYTVCCLQQGLAI